MRFPWYTGICGKNTVKYASIEKDNNYRDKYGKKISPKEAKKDEKKCKRIDDAAGTNVVGRSCEKPDQNVRPEIGAKEDQATYLTIEKEKHSS